jgi:uncharacterized protein (TIGR03083 family)
MPETDVLYLDTRTRITDLARSLSADELETKAPATPEWAVRDILCHLSGVLADILAGNLDGVATEPWTAAQVAARCDKSVDEVLDEWSANGPQVEAMLNTFGSAGTQLVADAVTHEHDIRGALNKPGERDSDAADAALQWLVAGLGTRIGEGGFPALRLSAGIQEWTLGDGEPSVSVTAPSEFEVLRALIGRRSPTQVAGWKWDGDAGPYLGVLAPWGLRNTDLVE